MHPTTAPDGEGGHTLRFVPTAIDPAAADEIVVVLDTTWTSLDPTDPRLGLRDLAAHVLETRDLFREAFELVDAWASSADVVETMTIDGTSFWYRARLGQWHWLVDELLWLAVLDVLLAAHPFVTRIAADPDADDDLRIAIEALAARDGLVVAMDGSAGRATSPVSEPAGTPADMSTPTTATPPSGPDRRGRSLLARLRWRYRPPAPERRRRWLAARLAELERVDTGRLLVIEAHARQRIDVDGLARLIDPYLGPLVDRLRIGSLDPIELDIRTAHAEDEDRAQHERDEVHMLPADVLTLDVPRGMTKAAKTQGSDVADRIAAMATPMPVHGVDLGPWFRTRLEGWTRRMFWRCIVDTARAQALLRRLRPAGVLFADEYHRQDWMGAAAAEGIPTAAIQHGVIHRWHPGYLHRDRPATLRLPDRTYVFGSWERDLLANASCYDPGEVVVGGSPRLDLIDERPADRERVRTELGIARSDRMIVLSGTWGSLSRRFHYTAALAAVFDRPLERVHLVVKLHPSERDEGPYRAVIESVAARGGFEPPPITVVQSIDLYRLLAAADAHLGIYSTVLTEAVVTGTTNLLVDRFAAGDLLGYVQAGVAIPIRDGANLLDALDLPSGQAMPTAARSAFLAAHFEPGSASDRIAEDLETWLR